MSFPSYPPISVSSLCRDSYEPTQYVDVQPGRWVSLPDWSKVSAAYRQALSVDSVEDNSPYTKTFYLAADESLKTVDDTKAKIFPLEPHKDQGINCGNWLSFGWNDLPADQAVPNSVSTSFTSAPLEDTVALSGFCTAILRLTAEREGRYSIAVRLSHLHANGTALRVTYGLLNLAQWEGNRKPRSVFPANQTLSVPVELNVAGYTVPKGDRLVLSVSPSYAPTMYPATHLNGLSLNVQGSRLVLQTLPPEAFQSANAHRHPVPLINLSILATSHRSIPHSRCCS